MKATDVLKEEHALIERALAVLERVLIKIEQGHLLDLALMARLTEFFEEFADHAHHRKEEEVLFPALEEHGVPRDGGPIGVMLMEHAQGRTLLGALRTGDPGEIVRAGKAYARLLRQHIEKENQVLFSMAERLLPPETQDAVWKRFEELEQQQASLRVHAENLVRALEEKSKK